MQAESADELGSTARLSATHPDSSRPLVSMEGFARFEQRARQRRIEKRLAAARAAIATSRFADARAAVAEVRELDASNPDLPGIEADLRAADRMRPAGRSVAPRVAAATAFVAVTLAASWLGSPPAAPSYPATPAARMAAEPETTLVSTAVQVDLSAPPIGEPLVGTVGEASLPEPSAAASPVADIDGVPPAAPRAAEPVPVTNVAATSGIVRPPETRAIDPAPPAVASGPPPTAAAVAAALPAAPPASPRPEAPVAAGPVSVPVVSATVAAVSGPPAAPPVAADVPDDDARVRAALGRYQAAYERLDAAMAQAVWPGVNQAALARAFDSLASQTLQFDDCRVQLRGATATATCRGSARYVPKVGRREPRVESRVWNFTLRKFQTDWAIESARAER